jgi:polyisoprenyl-phosphate glycosyltransferase
MLSVVVPIYNEEDVLDEFHQSLIKVLKACSHRYEIIFVDDGSTDQTVELLESMRESDPAIALLELSRNFGKDIALSAGLDHALGDAVIVIDADLQDPPELIHDFIREWENGYDVVYGQRSERQGETWLKTFTAKWFYRIINVLGDVEIPRDVGDYRLLSRRAVDALIAMPERHRYMKGLYAWIGFPQKSIPYVRKPRVAGDSKWNYWRLWNFALEGITSFSTAPLKIATYLGIMTSGVSFLYGIFFLLRTLFFGNPVAGYPSLVVIILFLGGIQLICLGIIGEYVGRTYAEAKSRALYLVKGYHPSKPASEEGSLNE